MTPHKTKDDSLGNLTKAVNSLREERARAQSRASKVARFDKLPYFERLKYWRSIIPRGKRGMGICFIREKDKIDIMNFIDNKGN